MLTTTQTNWLIDQTQSHIEFKISPLIFAAVKGTFSKFGATIYTDAKDFKTAKINFWMDADSLSTGDTERDDHIKSGDFFNTKTHKQITFISSGIKKTDLANNYELRGELTIKGLSEKVTLNAQFNGILKDGSEIEHAQFIISGKINRIDWGLTWNESTKTGGLMESADVDISCIIELTTQA
jgi:polyisoprenoid-binding protein YceI